MQELSGGGPAPNGAPQRIEAGAGGYDNDGGYGDRNAKPWERGPTGGPAPWQRSGEERGRRDEYSSGGAAPWESFGGYGAPPGAPGSMAPWQQQQQQQAPPGGYTYSGYSGGYADPSGYPQSGMGPPPGLSAPPGLGGMYQQQYGANGSIETPPPPPSGNAPPPPPGDAPPPPPPSDQPPPPPHGA